MGGKGSSMDRKKKKSKKSKEGNEEKKTGLCCCCNTNFYELEVELRFSFNRFLTGVLTEVTQNRVQPTTKNIMCKRVKDNKHPKFIINCPHKALQMKCNEDFFCPPQEHFVGGDFSL